MAQGMARRVSGVLVVLICAVTLLVACGGGGGGTTGSDKGIPAPPNSADYQKGKNTTLDGLVDTTGSQFSNFPGKVSDRKDYQSTSGAADIAAFYKKEMVARGWQAEQDGSQSAGGVNALLFSRDKQKTAGFIFIIDATTLGGTGSTVLVGSATQ